MGHHRLIPYLMLLSISYGALAGCGKEEEKDKNATSGAADLRGLWTGDCLAINDSYGRIVIKFLSETFTYQSTRYSDASCTKATDVIVGRGSFVFVADEAAGEDDADAEVDENSPKKGGIDYTFEEFTWEFTTEPALAVDWAVYCKGRLKSDGIADVLGGRCTVEETVLNFTAKQYGSFVIQDSKLFATDLTTNGIAAESRATAIDLTSGGMTKQEITE